MKVADSRVVVDAFYELCQAVGREGIIGFSSLSHRRLLPEQETYLARKLGSMVSNPSATAVSIALLYREEEIRAIPDRWVPRAPHDGSWNDYGSAYAELNRLLNRVVTELGDRFGGIVEQATMTGYAAQVTSVHDYFAACVSHRAFAQAAGVGWRGKSGLIITPEAGPAVRFATLFLPFAIPSKVRTLAGCEDCNACVEVCPVLRKGQTQIRTLREDGYLPASRRQGDYREACRLRVTALGLDQEVCGICVLVCWEAVRENGGDVTCAGNPAPRC